MLDFFGLTPEYKSKLHRQIFEFVTYGKGGWEWQTVYNLPIGLRNMYFNMLVGEVKKENKAVEKSQRKK
jgi:hypothetical protein